MGKKQYHTNTYKCLIGARESKHNSNSIFSTSMTVLVRLTHGRTRGYAHYRCVSVFCIQHRHSYKH